jgi:hypothetical protein
MLCLTAKAVGLFPRADRKRCIGYRQIPFLLRWQWPSDPSKRMQIGMICSTEMNGSFFFTRLYILSSAFTSYTVRSS